MFDDFEVECFFTIGVVLGIIAGILIGLAIAYAKSNDKFCPECGARYGVTAEYCSNDACELKEVKN